MMNSKNEWRYIRPDVMKLLVMLGKRCLNARRLWRRLRAIEGVSKEIVAGAEGDRYPG